MKTLRHRLETGLELQRLPGRHHIGIHLDIRGGRHAVEAGSLAPQRLRRLQSGDGLAGRIDVQQHVIDRPAGQIINQLVQGDSLVHRIVKDLEFHLAFAQLFLDLLAAGDFPLRHLKIGTVLLHRAEDGQHRTVLDNGAMLAVLPDQIGIQEEDGEDGNDQTAQRRPPHDAQVDGSPRKGAGGEQKDIQQQDPEKREIGSHPGLHLQMLMPEELPGHGEEDQIGDGRAHRGRIDAQAGFGDAGQAGLAGDAHLRIQDELDHRHHDRNAGHRANRDARGARAIEDIDDKHPKQERRVKDGGADHEGDSGHFHLDAHVGDP